VILIDANILVYAHVSSFAQHNLARDWLDQQLNASTSVGLPWPSVLAFLCLVTNLHGCSNILNRSTMLGSKCAPGLNLRRLGYRNPQSGTLICWANFLHYLAFTVTSSPTLTSLHWRWNTG
jgi:hypothetical protein